MTENTELTPHGEMLIRLPQVLAMTGRGQTATLDDVKAGTFPKPIKCGSSTLWVWSEVQAWIAQLIQNHRGQS
mgnify:CR=1 FL=1